MQAPKFWYPHKKSYINFRAWILSPIGLLIYQISKYRFCNKPAYQGETPIICIGNATVGGTGKTPTAILIAQLAHSMGYQPAFLTKGYGGTITEPYLVQSNDKPHKTGDEALILNVHAPCFIAKNRVAGANHIDALKKFDLIITDDGLQNHPSLYKQCAILTVDKNRLFGNAFLMPSGPLREPVQKALHKAHCVLMIGYKERVEIPKVLTETTKSIIQAYKKPIAHGADLKGENVVVFSGLGNNDQFLQTVQQSGAHIIHSEG
ncbi:MAG: tetraacyldisaccharide 4'-kinase, partial [Alphaproteobacteria bacterium]